MITFVTFIDYLLCARYHSKHFTWINPFKPHNNHIKQILKLILVTEEETGTESLRNLPKVTKQGRWRSQDLNPDGLALEPMLLEIQLCCLLL